MYALLWSLSPRLARNAFDLRQHPYCRLSPVPHNSRPGKTRVIASRRSQLTRQRRSIQLSTRHVAHSVWTHELDISREFQDGLISSRNERLYQAVDKCPQPLGRTTVHIPSSAGLFTGAGCTEISFEIPRTLCRQHNPLSMNEWWPTLATGTSQPRGPDKPRTPSRRRATSQDPESATHATS